MKCSIVRFSVIFTLIIFFDACSPASKTQSLQSGVPKAGFYVEKYGQIVSAKELSYLNYLQSRLSTVLTKSSGQEKRFKIILLNTRKPIASYAGDQIILISKGMLVPAKTEAEFAFILAHEMAHQHLGHDPDNQTYQAASDAFSLTADESDEIEADRLAIATISAAGYDPRLAFTALKNVYTYSAPYILNENNYPSLDKRIDEINSFLEDSGWMPPGTINRREYSEFRKSLF